MKVKIKQTGSKEWHIATVPDEYIEPVLDAMIKYDGSGIEFCKKSGECCEECKFLNPFDGNCGARLISKQTPIGSINARQLFFKRASSKVRLNV